MARPLIFSKRPDDPVAFDAVLDEHPTLVVRPGDRRTVVVLDTWGETVVATSSDPAVASAAVTPCEPSGCQLEVVARQPGKAQLKFHPAGKPDVPFAGSLKVLAYPPLPVRVNVYLVTDGRGDRSSLSFADVAARLKDVNAILVPQANVSFLTHLAERFTVAADLARPDRTAREKDAVWAELNAKADQFDASRSHVSLYVVKRWGANDTDRAGGVCRVDVVGSGVIGRRRCVAEDGTDPTAYAAALAHGLLHSLGAEHDELHGEQALMSESAAGGTLIYPSTVREIRGLP